MALFYRIFAELAKRLPRRPLQWFINAALRASFALNRRRRRKALAVYGRILSRGGRRPSEQELSAVLDASIRHHARLILSLFCRAEDIEFARARVDLDCLPRLEECLRDGKGVIVVLSNFGLFGHAFMALATRGLPLLCPVLDAGFYAHAPYGWAGAFLSLGNASRACVNALRRGGIVVIPTMYNFLSKDLSIEFFGAPARLTSAPERLSRATGAPILPVFALAEGDRCRLVPDGPIRAAAGRDPVGETTRRLARVQERYIARHPEQWEAHDDIWDLERMDRNRTLVRGLLRRL